MPITAAPTDNQGQLDAVKKTREAIKTNPAGTELSAGVAGSAAQFADNNDTFNTAVVGTATFALIIVLILIIFRSPIAALLPIVRMGAALGRRPAVAAGILLAAFVMSMFLVPSLTALLGHKAWWPGHGDVAQGPVETTPDQPPVRVESN